MGTTYLLGMRALLTPADHPLGTWFPPVSWFVSRVYWREVGRRLPLHPELLSDASVYLTHALETGEHACSRKYVKRWCELLSEGMPAVVRVLTSPGDGEEQVLRSCAPLPFMSLVSESRRHLLYDAVGIEVRAMKNHQLRSA